MNFTWFKYVQRAFAVMGMLTSTLPQMIADGKITVHEMAILISEMAKICHWDVEIEVPQELRDSVVGTRLIS